MKDGVNNNKCTEVVERTTGRIIFNKAKKTEDILKEKRRKQRTELAEYKTASEPTSSRSFHLEKSRSVTTATTKHCAVLNRH